MKISRCTNCGERFNGLRCPTCGRPLPITGALGILLPAVVAFFCVIAIIPDERVPRVETLGDGTTAYCFRSLLDSVLMPVVLSVMAVFGILFSVIFKTRKIAKPEDSSTGWRKYLGRAGKGVGYVLGACVFAMVAVLFLTLVVVTPLCDFRCVEVGQNTVEMHSLFSSWSLPREHVVRARYVREHVLRRQELWVHMRLVLEDSTGHRHKSVDVGLKSTDPKLASFEATFQRLQSQLSEQGN